MEPWPRKEDFERDYAKHSGLTVDELRALGMYALRCDCGDEGCRGWQMVHAASLSPNDTKAAARTNKSPEG